MKYVFAASAVILLIPLFVFLPLNFSNLIKVLIVTCSGVIAIIGIYIQPFYKGWMVGLLLTAISMVCAYVLFKRYTQLVEKEEQNNEYKEYKELKDDDYKPTKDSFIELDSPIKEEAEAAELMGKNIDPTSYSNSLETIPQQRTDLVTDEYIEEGSLHQPNIVQDEEDLSFLHNRVDSIEEHFNKQEVDDEINEYQIDHENNRREQLFKSIEQELKHEQPIEEHNIEMQSGLDKDDYNDFEESDVLEQIDEILFDQESKGFYTSEEEGSVYCLESAELKMEIIEIDAAAALLYENEQLELYGADLQEENYFQNEILGVYYEQLQLLQAEKKFNEFEKIIKAILETDLDDVRYYKFASMLRDYYANTGQREQLSLLLEYLKERFQGHETFYNEVLYYLEQYC
ncbi:hypothetical protein [Bacillus taeanensis]|uniref:Uncharacterized protein n=1 Tax=Bacillus taeanensis TaxID=273032 RepID=A0A366Y171_9BACI|nr:hypothetical protein [Bacillus taeanensis]RBW71586.1 hypothetical protein DS031_02230 [Bacillus taeanensis]